MEYDIGKTLLELTTGIYPDILTDIYNRADSRNMGDAAGRRSGSFNLGTCQKPILLNEDNILDYIVDLGTVLDETSVMFGEPRDTRFVIFHPAFMPILKTSMGRICNAEVAKPHALSKGRGRSTYGGMIDGMEIYTTEHLPVSYNNGKKIYHILFGIKSFMLFDSSKIGVLSAIVCGDFINKWMDDASSAMKRKIDQVELLERLKACVENFERSI